MALDPSASLRARLLDAPRRLFRALPTGQSLGSVEWARRHRAIFVLLMVHVVAVPLYGISQGEDLTHTIAGAAIIAALAFGARSSRLGSTARSVMATLGLVTSSAILTHFSGGLIEMHFHFFVMVAVIALYQSWVPFLVALGFVVLHHTIGGELFAESVFNHPSGATSPFIWALIHGGFILAESAACLVAWRLNEIALENERDARLEMEKAHDDLAAAQALSSLGSWEWDPVTDTVWWSAQMYRLVSRDPKTFTPTREGFIEHVVDEDRDRVAALISAGALEGGSLQFECVVVRADGERRILDVRGSRSAGDASGSLHGSCQDITERKALEAEVQHRAFHDALTDLPNRALFLDRLEHGLAVSERISSPLSLLYIDLDHFKTVNDNLGHDAGDQLLQQIATRLYQATREADTVARLGGDEFAIVLEDTDRDGAVKVAEKLLELLEEPFSVNDTRLLARASIGVASAAPTTDASELLRQADIAMYASKRQGTHGLRVFTDGMHSSLTTRMELEAELAEAIEHEQLLLHYQPLVDLPTGRVEGVEALVRWDHPQRGVLPPSEFIPLAEEMGLITPLGEWVLRRATADVRSLQATLGRPLYVSVNVAAPQLHTDIVATVDSALEDSGLSAEFLMIEITETCLMSQEESVVDKLTQLRDRGVRVAIDDFGTGYSSLSYLRELPIDHLKIDRSFIRDIADGPEDSALAQSIIKLGSLFGLRTVAEGIETPAQAAILGQLGCDMGQGYLYHRPTDLLSLIAALTPASGQQTSELVTPSL